MRASDGTFLLFTIGQTLDPASESKAALDKSITGSMIFRTELHYASQIEGPWTSLGCVINGSNPSPYALPNGTIVVAYKGLPNGLRIATAPNWRSQFTTIVTPGASTSCCGDKSGAKSCCGELLLQPQPYGHPYIEDFFIWYDA
eukprot:SAG31_NODE_6947_length_1840_cov_1.595635_1_plen_143_part_10